MAAGEVRGERLRTRRVLGEAGSVYATHWRLLTVTAAIAFVCLDLVAGLLWPLFAEESVSATIAGLVALGASYYYQGMVALVVAAWRDGRPAPGIWHQITRVPVLKLMAVDVLATAAALGGLALGVLPGLIVLALTAVVGPVTALERPAVGLAFRRSVAIVRPSFARVLLVVAGLWVILIAITVGAMLAGGALTGGSVLGHWLGAFLASVVVAPITAAIAASIYFDLGGSVGGPGASSRERGY